jgi:hypothetical protein
MPMMSIGTTSLAAGASSGNVLSGKAFEFVGRAAARDGLTVQILNGTEIIAQDEAVPVSGATITLKKPDDYHFQWIAGGRQQIIIKNPTGGALSYALMLELQPV